jgi:hypothetical protein
LRCIECYRFRDGRIADGRVYFDAFGFMKQLGIGAPGADREQGRGATETQARH